jgi:hypothetical protein
MPHSNRSRRHDDDDDRPRRKTRRPRNDDDDDRPRRPKKKKSGGSPVVLFVLIAVGAIVLVGGGVFAVILLTKEDKSTTTVAKTDATKGSGKKDYGPAPTTTNWVDFASPDGSFTAKFPQPPTKRAEQFQTARGPLAATQYESGIGPMHISVMTTGIPGIQPGDPVSNDDIEKALENVCTIILQRIDGARQLSRKPVDIDGRPGRELEFDLADGGAGISRALIWKAQIFILLIIDKRSKPDQAIVEKFWAGFVMK